MTKLFVLFCLAKDGESADINCLVFSAYCKNGKILIKCQVRRFHQCLVIFSNMKYCYHYNVQLILSEMMCCIVFSC